MREIQQKGKSNLRDLIMLPYSVLKEFQESIGCLFSVCSSTVSAALIDA